MKKIILIDDDILVQNLQKLSIELESLKSLISYCLSQSNLNIELQRFSDLTSTYSQTFYNYEMLKQEL